MKKNTLKQADILKAALEAPPEGITARALSVRFGVPVATLRWHLMNLRRLGLVEMASSSKRQQAMWGGAGNLVNPNASVGLPFSHFAHVNWLSSWRLPAVIGVNSVWDFADKVRAAG